MSKYLSSLPSTARSARSLYTPNKPWARIPDSRPDPLMSIRDLHPNHRYKGQPPPSQEPAPHKSLWRHFWDYMTAKDGDAAFRFSQLWIWPLMTAAIIVGLANGPGWVFVALAGLAAIPAIGFLALFPLALVFLAL
jgi:hypothetical protein